MKTHAVSFPGANGETLAARLDVPVDGEPIACALLAHCFTCSKNLNAVVNISRALTRERFAVLRFDFTGLGESTGEFETTNFSSNVGDLVAAGAFIRSEGLAPDVLVGHSLGGAAVIRAARSIEGVRAVATIGAPFDPWHVTQLLEGSREEIEEAGEAIVRIGGRTLRVRRQLLDDLGAGSLEADLRELRKPLLVFHSPLDQTVGIENAASIFQAARHPKSFVTLDRADHLLTDESDSRYVGAVLASWASRYLPPVEPPASESDLVAANQVATRTGSGFRTDVQVRGHGLVADEPRAVGGSDEGPSPYDLLLAALGACTGMTLRMYAGRKGWPLEEVRVTLRHERIHAVDEVRCAEGQEARVDRIDREVEITGELSMEQRSRLGEIADRCPVHRTLSAGLHVESRLAPSSPPDAEPAPDATPT